MINDIHENETILAFYNMIPYFEELIGCELGFTISNTERFLYAQYNDSFKNETSDISKMPKTGEPIPKNSAADLCLKQKKTIHVEIPEQVFGIPVKTTAIPVWENGEVAGVMVLAKSIKRQKQIMDMSNDVFCTLTDINDSTAEMAARFEEINSSNREIEQYTEQTQGKADKTDEVLRFINGITQKTNLLGLNASIEAARSGAAGRGFSVVATEISKLSNSTKKSVKEIDEVLSEIHEDIRNVGEKINGSNRLLDEQIAQLLSIANSIKNLNSVSERLKDFAKEL